MLPSAIVTTLATTATALAGQRTNVGTVTGQDANNPPGTLVTDDNLANYFGDAPAGSIVKFGSGVDADTPTGPHVAAGSTVAFSYVVSNTGHGPLALEGVLHRERVDHRREHAHVIGRDAVHAGFGKPRAADDVAAADHEAHLDAETEDFRDFACDSPDDDGVDAVLMIAEQRLAAQFQQYSTISRRALRHEPLAPAVL